MVLKLIILTQVRHLTTETVKFNQQQTQGI